MEPSNTKVIGHAGTAAGAASVVAWLWNAFVPEHPMPAEVAGALGGLVGPILAWIVGWLPAR